MIILLSTATPVVWLVMSLLVGIIGGALCLRAIYPTDSTNPHKLNFAKLLYVPLSLVCTGVIEEIVFLFLEPQWVNVYWICTVTTIGFALGYFAFYILLKAEIKKTTTPE